MSNEKYNGWSNRETWLVNIWFGDCFGSLDFEDTRDPYEMGENFRDFVQVELYDADIPDVWRDFICLESVNWYELGEAFIEHWYEETVW